MRRYLLRLSIVTVLLAFAAVRTAAAQVCVSIDEARDTLRPDERSAALLLVAKQFELSGTHVGTTDCATTYTLSHIQLGNTITVTMAGPNGRREGTALGLDDLPALYSQMVRSMITGRSMESLSVVDRTNVTASQDLPPRRIQSESFGYARLGYGGIFGDQTYGGPAIGFGYRHEFNSFGIDVSYLNFNFDTADSYYSSSRNGLATSLLKLEGLYFTNPFANRTAYFGAGIGWGGTTVSSGRTTGHGHGLQGELTAGYELARATSVRVFVQADATLPFYVVTSETYVASQRLANGRYTAPSVTTSHRYVPSLAVSLGLGWQKGSKFRDRRP